MAALQERPASVPPKRHSAADFALGKSLPKVSVENSVSSEILRRRLKSVARLECNVGTIGVVAGALTNGRPEFT